MKFLQHLLLLVENDLRVELRTKEALFASALFVILILFIFNFSLGSQPDLVQKTASGIIWSTIAFAGLIALPHLTRRDLDDRVIDGLMMSGCGGITLFFAKLLSACIFLMAIELFLTPLFILFFNVPVGDWIVPYSYTVVGGTIGFAALGTLFSALLNQVRMKDLFLPVVLYPVLIPWLIVSMKITSEIFQGELKPNLSFLLGFDLIFVTACALLYEFVIEDLR